jgi:alpha-L-glutamate ligase-like protein
MNRRNAEYLMPSNPRSSFPLVDNKVLTKRLAEQHGIPTPQLYHVVENHSGIRSLNRLLDDCDEFVVKPARGFGGSGILLVTGKNPAGYITQSGKTIPWDSFAQHISDILSGIYSLEALEDHVIIEALLHPDPVFSAVTFQGVPDERIVVYRGVPVMAMVRLPTRASDGKANLHRGAIGAGVDLRNGTTMLAVLRSQIVVNHPDTGNPVNSIKVPHWDEMLLTAARVADLTDIRYLGADFVIDRERGPMLLELNARPGLAIQMANQSGLRPRLERVNAASQDDFLTPETRVAWAKEHLA